MSPEILILCDDKMRESNWILSLRAFHSGPIITSDIIDLEIAPSVMQLHADGWVILDIQNEDFHNIVLALNKIRKLKSRIRILVVENSNATSIKAVVEQIGATWFNDDISSFSPVKGTTNKITHFTLSRELSTLLLLDDSGCFRKLAELESEIINRALVHSFGNVLRASAALGVGRSTLYRKIYEYRLKRFSKFEPKQQDAKTPVKPESLSLTRGTTSKSNLE